MEPVPQVPPPQPASGTAYSGAFLQSQLTEIKSALLLLADKVAESSGSIGASSSEISLAAKQVRDAASAMMQASAAVSSAPRPGEGAGAVASDLAAQLQRISEMESRLYSLEEQNAQSLAQLKAAVEALASIEEKVGARIATELDRGAAEIGRKADAVKGAADEKVVVAVQAVGGAVENRFTRLAELEAELLRQSAANAEAIAKVVAYLQEVEKKREGQQ